VSHRVAIFYFRFLPPSGPQGRDSQRRSLSSSAAPEALARRGPSRSEIQRGWCWWVPMVHLRATKVHTKWHGGRTLPRRPCGDQHQRSGRSLPISRRNILTLAAFKPVLRSSYRWAQPLTMSCSFRTLNPDWPLVAPYSATRRRQVSRSSIVTGAV
jgi:hypothetical protein